MIKISLFGKKFIISYKTITFIISLTASILFIAGYFIKKNNIIIEFEEEKPDEINDTSSKDIENDLKTDEQNNNDENNENNEKTETIMVYVTGCVKNPGIIELEKGSIIYDAVQSCWGFTEDANKNIDLVYEINNNITLRIKKINNYEIIQNGIEIIEDTGAMFSEETLTGNNKEIININTASIEQLGLLSGIGETIALNIISYRNLNGDFIKIEDIMNVPGIKNAKFNQIKDYITVE